MGMKIRTVKPAFYRHRELYDLEKETGLPFRLAFEGLWGYADREGRFLWKPEDIKLDVLPFDEVDFSLMLDALAARGFVVKYRKKAEGDALQMHVHAYANKCIGYIPTFLQHQRPNKHEAKSILPQLDESCEVIPVTYPQFPTARQCTCMHGNKSEEVEWKGSGKEVEVESKERNSKKPATRVVSGHPLIQAYCSAWKERYKSRPEILGKDQGITKRIVQGVGAQRSIELVKSYLEMNNAWFLKKRHDLATFEANLNAVVQFHDTGVTISDTEARHAEDESYHANQVRRLTQETLL